MACASRPLSWKCVAYIGHTVGGEPRYEGTGFFVGEPIPGFPDHMFSYFVTAKHVADKVAGNFWVRLNTKDGPAVEVDPGNAHWIYHPTDPTADVAMLYWPIRDDLDHMVIHRKMILVSREEIKEKHIGLGDEVFLAGVFASVHGSNRNTPIVRKGHLAMLPEDRVAVGKDTDAEVYLIEAHSFGGLSGSPVFVRDTLALDAFLEKPGPNGERVPVTHHTAGRIHLLGLMHGHWEIDEADLNALYMHKPTKKEREINLGISLVVPASKILETMDHPLLMAVKEIVVKERRARLLLPVQDAATGDDEDSKGSGPEPERLSIDLPMDEAVKKMFGAGKPSKT